MIAGIYREDGPIAPEPDVENLGAPECFGMGDRTKILIHRGNVTEQHDVSIAFEGKVVSRTPTWIKGAVVRNEFVDYSAPDTRPVAPSTTRR